MASWVYPPTCPAPATVTCNTFVGQPLGYDYSSCPLAAALPLLPGFLAPDTCPIGGEGGGGEEEECDPSMLPLWIAMAVYMFYGLALVCEEFMVPAISVLCERKNIPPHVAGATLLAAGCNSPELIASSISLFIAHSTVGAGTIVGSAPFNILGITGASVLAVGGLTLPWSMMAREATALFSVLAAFIYVMQDSRIYWYEALGLASIYLVYVAVCVFWSRILNCFSSSSPSADADASGRTQYAQLADEAPPGKVHSKAGMLLKQSRFYAYAPVGRAGGFAWRSKYISLDADSKDRPLVIAPLGHDGTPVEHLYRAINLAAAYEIELTNNATELHINTRVRVGGRRKLDKEWTADIQPVFRRSASISGAAAMGGSKALDPSMARLEGSDKAKLAVNPVEKPLRLRRIMSYSGPHNAPSKYIENQHVFRVHPGADKAILKEWYDALRAKAAALRAARAKTAPKGGLLAFGVAALEGPDDDEEDDEDIDEAEGEHDEHNVWAIPPSPMGAIMWLITIPLVAPIHATVPDVRRHEDRYAFTCLMSLVWLIILATIMTSALEAIGCIIHFDATVMGLTLGAMGTSFPNLYASVLAAQAGEGEMAIVQAFASNVFNVCIALGVLWLIQSTSGQCQFGTPGATQTSAACGGCYMPSGIALSCPHLPGQAAGPDASGSLTGTVIVTAGAVATILLMLFAFKGRIPPFCGVILLAMYGAYAVYEVLAAKQLIPILCIAGSCI